MRYLIRASAKECQGVVEVTKMASGEDTSPRLTIKQSVLIGHGDGRVGDVATEGGEVTGNVARPCEL